MNRHIAFSLIVLSSVLHCRTVQSQEVARWTLEECIAYAYEHNIGIKQTELEVQSRQIARSDAGWAYAPDISASGSYSFSGGRVLDPTTYEFVENRSVNGTTTSVGASVTLFNGLRNFHNLERSRLDLRAALLGVEKARNDVRLTVTAYYLEILCAEENIRNAVRTVETLKLQEEKTRKSVEAGKVTSSDLLQIRSQRANAENTLLSARNAYDIARLNICQLLEIDDYTTFRTVAPADDLSGAAPMAVDTDALLWSAQQLPEVESARLGIDIARRDLRIARSSYYPTLSLSAGYGSSYSDARQKMFMNPDGTYRYEAYPFAEQYKHNANSYISVSLNVPLFGRLTTRHNVRRQKIAIRRAEYALRTAEKQVHKEATQALIDVRTAWDKYLSSQRYVASAEEAARRVERRYDLGAATVVDYNTAIAALVQARVQLLQAKYEYIFKTEIINFYLGRSK
ncbi:TolC family protein [Alistipes sp.]|uniref:TolC family protein n=1 Tax=Alistipes sp. TaxID=1872444 RepID=UPI003A847CB7